MDGSRVILAAHRGDKFNYPENTMPAFESAIELGCDMIETDVSMTKDGVLCVFHPRMERSHLAMDVHIDEMTWDEVKELRFVNYDRTVTQFPLMTFDELLDRFKDRCYINVDKFWNHPKEIYEAIKAHGMIDQIVVKSALSDEVLDVLREVAPELPFMPIVKNTHPKHKELMESGECSVKVYASVDAWYGVTYKEDRESVYNSLAGLKTSGKYPQKLNENI